MDSIILGLDRASGELRQQIINILPIQGVWGIKLGNLILKQGLENILKNIGGRVNVFVDLKHTDVHDRMVSIIKLYRALGPYAPQYLSVDSGVNSETLKSIRALSGQMTIVMIPIRSDQNDEECKREYGYADFEWLMRRQVKAEFAGISAITCPAQFLRYLEGTRSRKTFRTIIATGVRSKGTGKNEHINPMPPEEALTLGATHVVIEREVTEATDQLRRAPYTVHNRLTVLGYDIGGDAALKRRGIEGCSIVSVSTVVKFGWEQDKIEGYQVDGMERYLASIRAYLADKEHTPA